VNPFERIRARSLLPCLVAVIVASFCLVKVVWPVPGDDPEHGEQLSDSVAMLLSYGLVLAITAHLARRAGLSVSGTYSIPPSLADALRAATLGLPLVGLAFIVFWVVYAPLSLAWPGFVEEWVLRYEPLLYSRGPPYPFLANLLAFLGVVLAAPLVEEWFFRGLLMRRWSLKWGPRAGILGSSLVFAAVHVDMVGGLAFAVVMCGLYVHHRSLWVPVIVHASNNALCWILVVFDAHAMLPELSTAEQLRSAWWLAVAGLLLVLPWLPRALRAAKRPPGGSWEVAVTPDERRHPAAEVHDGPFVVGHTLQDTPSRRAPDAESAGRLL
jgi:hypothetical protein